MSAIFITIISTAIIGLFGWFVAGGRAFWDRHKVYQWLKSNTHDKPGESHVDIITIARGTRLPEDRVHSACMSSGQKIYYFSNSKEQWSVWRKEPQSVYENLTKEEIDRRLRF